MAGALKPVVLLMSLAAALFVVDAWLDGIYPGGPQWSWSAYQSLGWTSYLFAAINALVAFLIARGSEHTLTSRIAFAAFFVAERPLSAFALGPKPPAAVAVHLVTAVVELAILVGALRVWRLGHSYAPAEVEQLFALSGEPADRASGNPLGEEDDGPVTGPTGALLGTLTLLLAAVFVVQGIVSGFAPWGDRAWGLAGEDAGWLVYLFAAVILTVAMVAVHGRTLALRLLMVLAVIYFIERVLSPLALRQGDPLVLGLHGLAAAVALALAVATAGVIRELGERPTAHVGGP
jgi:hypothetical protein